MNPAQPHAQAVASETHVIGVYVSDLEQALAPDRLAPYRPAGGDDMSMLVTYYWNIALGRELHLSMGAVEVTMRNRVHQTLVAYSGYGDWYDHLQLQPRELRQVNDAKQDILRARRPVTPGRVVAALRFGFWTSLLSSGYGALWNPNSAAMIRQAFPHLQPHQQHRGFVHDRYNRLRLMRNRISHHEPIWQGVRLQTGQLVPLNQLYSDAIEAIGWASPRVQASVIAFDRFQRGFQHGRIDIEAEIRKHLGIQ